MAESWKVKNRRLHANLGMAAAVTLGLIALSCPFIAHKWDGGVGDALKAIHYGKFLPADIRWIWIDSQGFFLAFLVVSGWLMHKKTVKQAVKKAADDPKVAGSSVTLVDLDGRGLAPAWVKKLQSQGVRAFHCPIAKVAELDLAQERWLLFVGDMVQVTPEVRSTLQPWLEQVAPGSLKRLEFAFVCSSQAEADDTVVKFSAALGERGARPIKGLDGLDEQGCLEALLKRWVKTSPLVKARMVEGATARASVEPNASPPAASTVTATPAQAQ